MKTSALPRINLLLAVSVLTLLAVAVPTLLAIGPLLDRWLALALLAAFGILAIPLSRQPDDSPQARPGLPASLLLGAQSVLLLALLGFFPQAESLTTLFYLLCIEAMLYFPVRSGLLWLLGYLLVVAVYQFDQSGLLEALGDLALFTAGLLLFGLVSAALRRARLAQLRSQVLLGELHAANRQLQEYADQVETASVHAERNRLAREMHDTLGHHLTAAVVQMEAARRQAPSDPDGAAEAIRFAQEQVRQALGELRQTVGRLRQPLEADLQLEQALPRLAESFRRASQLTVHLDMPPNALALPDTHRLALYRAAQEGLTNVQRHADAGQAWLRLQRLPASILLEIEDDGRGLPQDFSLEASARPTSFGLRGLRERMEQLGGRMSLEARPGGGARLRLSLPLPQEDPHA
ncbi:MAG: sensor histidine kinase [Chloroflexota bacterium]